MFCSRTFFVDKPSLLTNHLGDVASKHLTHDARFFLAYFLVSLNPTSRVQVQMARASSGARSGPLPELPTVVPPKGSEQSTITDFFNVLKKPGRPLGATAKIGAGRPPAIPVAPAPSKKPVDATFSTPATKKPKTSRIITRRRSNY